jgi:predicted metal-dependent HD superfamily phosphohydrolase
MRNILRPEHRQELIKLYSQDHRHYHTLEHVTTLFQLASSHSIRLSIPQILAIWYHDAIYDPTRKDNEENSCKLLLQHHEGNSAIIKGYLNRAINIIMDTKYHKSDDNESQIVLDLDLVGFGFDTETYDYTTELLRKEYSHLSDVVWKASRRLFLNDVLNCDYIFYTQFGRDFYEDNARRNIERELKNLR